MSKKILPKLRFRDFTTHPKWNIANLGDLSVPVTEKVAEKRLTLMSVTSGVGLVPQVEKFGREIAGNSYKNYYAIKKYDFAYNKSATKQFPEGYISMLNDYEEAALPNSIFTCFRITDEECCPEFFNQLFQNNYHGTWLRKYIEVGARAHGSLSIDNKYLWSMPIAIPTKSEQQKIADCLSSLDELIEVENKKLETLQKQKKGLMQKLFPAEGKSVPEWRFQEFVDGNQWEAITLDEFAEYRRGSFPQPYGLSKWYDDKNGLPFIQVYDVGENLQLKQDTKNKISHLAMPQSVFIAEGTLIITIQGSIGKVAITQYDAYIDRTLLLFENFHKEIDKKFVAYALQMLFDVEKRKAPGGIIKTITKEALSSFIIKIPHIREQEKIAKCIDEVTNLIILQEKKLETLKKHKTGLLQGLFPAIEEVYK